MTGSTIVLRQEGSAVDLMLRGHSRAEVLSRTGVDIGYNGRALREQVAGIDRRAYKTEHVRRRVDAAQWASALELVRRGHGKGEVLASLGLAGQDLISLEHLFGALDLDEGFAEARSEARGAAMREGMMAAHGAGSGFEVPEVQERSARVRAERYGAPFTLAEGSSLAAGARASIRSRRSSAGDEDPVERLHRRLVERFGEQDVERGAAGHGFRIGSRDLFVDMIDRGELPERLREEGEREQLNLVAFRRSAKGLDADLWFEMGCPDGRDWERDHSWAGSRLDDDLRVPEAWPKELTGTVGISRRAARAANGGAFYARELSLWRRDPSTPMGSVRGRLLCNRHRYIGKLPEEMSDLELLRGMRISGLVRGYTAFDNSGMTELIERYAPTSIYDPCAGWGERLATCAGHGVEYFGVDVNEEVVRGHQRMVERYDLDDQRTVVADSSRFDARGMQHEMVFTCPPYGDTEVYTAQGAENLGREEFLEWWSRVVEMSVGASTRVFAYQVNQAYRDEMNEAVEVQGWRLVDRIDVGRSAVSHFNKDADGKSRRSEFEQVQVFERA